jgi:AcrR family transcriptional regulator
MTNKEATTNPQNPGAEASTKQRIVVGARHHFFTHGFRGVTMDDLAGELGMSKKTLYSHFSSKAVLLEAVIAHKFSEVERELNQVTSGKSSDFTHALQRLLELLKKQLEEIQPAFIRDIRREAPALFARIESLRREHIQRHFGKLFEEGRQQGLVRSDIPLNLIIEALLGAVNAVMNPRKIEELGISPKSAFMSIIKVVLEGATTDKGRREAVECFGGMKIRNLNE